MANLLFCDSFDHYNLANMGQKWGGIFTTFFASLVTGRTVRGIQTVFNISGVIQTSDVTVIGAYRVSGSTGSSNTALGIGSPSSQRASLHFNNDGTCYVKDSTYAIKAHSEKVANEQSIGHYYELGISGGNIIVRVDGEEIIDVAGSLGAATDTFFIMGTGGGVATWYDDLYVADGFLSDVIIEAIHPDGTGNYSQWTPLSGANYTNVDETLASGTDYNSSTTDNQIDTFTFEDVSFSGTIEGVQLSIFCTYSSPGSSITGVCRISGTDYFHSYILGGTSETICHTFVWPVSPATGVAWTQSELNGAEFGYRHEDANSMQVLQVVVEVAQIRESTAQVSQVVLEAAGINLAEAVVSQALIELLTIPSECTCPESDNNFMY
jgi:hypothetical protein